MKAMGTYLDLATSAEWAEVNMASDLQYIFNKLKASYFSPWLDKVTYTVKWDKTCVIPDGSSFRFFETVREVLVASEMMVKPRIQLISVILHILIHIYLGTCSNGTITLKSHGDSFRELFLFFNKSLDTEISVSYCSIVVLPQILTKALLDLAQAPLFCRQRSMLQPVVSMYRHLLELRAVQGSSSLHDHSQLGPWLLEAA